MEAAKKVSLFSGPATKAPPPLELSGHIFWGNIFVIFLELHNKFFFLMAGPLKKNFFAASLKTDRTFHKTILLPE